MPKLQCPELVVSLNTDDPRCFLRQFLHTIKEEPELMCMVLANAAPWWLGVCRWLGKILVDVRPPLVNMIRFKRGVTQANRITGILRLSKSFSITGISLNDLGSDPDEAKQLCEQMWACETLTRIQFDMHTTPHSIANIFIRGLRERKLKRVTLCCDFKTSKGLDLELGASLGTLSRMEELNLRIVPREGPRIPALKNVLREIGACHNMQALTLSSMQIKDDDWQELVEGWGGMPSLSRLNLSDNCLSEVSIERLVNSHWQFSELYLSGNPLGPLGPEYLKPTFPSLRILSLNSTKIGAQGVSVLAQDAHRLLNLEYLKISNNGINREGGPAIVQLLTQCNALKRVNLSSNSLGTAVNVQMHSAIGCRKLCFINLRHNNLSSQQVDDFIDFACNLPRVQTGEMEYWI